MAKISSITVEHLQGNEVADRLTCYSTGFLRHSLIVNEDESLEDQVQAITESFCGMVKMKTPKQMWLVQAGVWNSVKPVDGDGHE
jgi:hypothetical protein